MRYNPFFYVSSDAELRIRDLQLIAQILIPETKVGDSFWAISSRELFLTLSLYLIETNRMPTLEKIHDLSKQSDFFIWLLTQVNENDQIYFKHLKQNAYSLLQTDEKTQKNILKDFHSRLSLFNDPIVGYAASDNDFDFSEIRRKKMSIYIMIPDSDKERLSPLLTLFWVQLINAISAHEPMADEPYSVLALMDEFGNMSRINKLKDGMSFLRSYHMRCIVMVQHLAQISSIYGRYDAKSFFNSKVKIAFALNDIDDAQFISKSLGSKTVKVSSSTVNSGSGDNPGTRSDSTNFQSRPLLAPDEMMRLPSRQAIILMESKNPIKAYKYCWYEQAKYLATVNSSI